MKQQQQQNEGQRFYDYVFVQIYLDHIPPETPFFSGKFILCIIHKR